MKLGFYMGYAQPGTNRSSCSSWRGRRSTRLRLGLGGGGLGVDAITPLAWLGAQTSTLKLGTAIMQLPGRSPANAAMTAVTLDLLSGGRFLMGLGTSGPQVVEGWHGQEWGKPLGKTREYVEIVRAIVRRERLEHHGAHYDIPVQGGTGLGKPLKLMARPLRADDPDLPGRDRAEGGRAGVRDRRRLAADLLVARAGAQRLSRSTGRATGFDIAPCVPAIVTDDVESGARC